MLEDMLLRRIFESLPGGSKGKPGEIVIVLTKNIRPIRVVKSRRTSTEYRNGVRDAECFMETREYQTIRNWRIRNQCHLADERVKSGKHGNESGNFITRWLSSCLAKYHVAAQGDFCSVNLVIQLEQRLNLCVSEHLETLKRLYVLYVYIFRCAWMWSTRSAFQTDCCLEINKYINHVTNYMKH